MIKAIKNNRILYITWLVMVVCILLSPVVTKLLSVVAFGIFLLFTVKNSLNASIVLLFALMPFANLFKLSAGTTSLFTLCELVVAAQTFLRRKSFKVIPLVLMLVLTVYLFFADLPRMNYLTVIKVIAGLVLIYVAIAEIKQEDVVHIAYFLSVGVILMMTLSTSKSFFSYITPYFGELNYLINETGKASDTLRSGGFLGDPNYCSALIMIVLALLCLLYYYERIRREFWVLIAFIIPLGFFTYSKSYFLCVSALSLFLLFFVVFPKSRLLGFALTCALAVGVYVVLQGEVPVINLILKRFTAGDFTTGRTWLNEVYWEYIISDSKVLFFGEGLSTNQITGYNNVHNLYIELIFRFGIFGTAIYMGILIANLCYAVREKSVRKIINFLPLVFFFVLFYFLGGATMYEVPFYIAISFLSLNVNEEKDTFAGAKTLNQ